MAKLIPVDEKIARLEPVNEEEEEVSFLEKFKRIQGPLPASILAQLNLAAGGGLQFVGENLLPDSVGKGVTEYGQGVSETAQMVLSQIQKENYLEPGSMAEATRSALTSVGSQAPALATGNLPLILSQFGIQAGAQGYGEARAEGATRGQSAIAGATKGLSEAATEALPVKFLTKFGTPFVRRLAQVYASEIPGEQINTIVDYVVDNKIKEYTGKPEATLDDLVFDLKRTLKTTVVQATLMAPIGHGAASAQAQEEQADLEEVQRKEDNRLAKLEKVEEEKAYQKLDLSQRGMAGTVTFSAERYNKSPEENAKNTKEARQALINLGLEFSEVDGFYEGSSEKSFVVKDEGYAAQAVAGLAKKYEQDSVLQVDSNGKSVFISAEGVDEAPGVMREVSEERAKSMVGYTYDPATKKYFGLVEGLSEVEAEVASEFDSVVDEMEQENQRGSISFGRSGEAAIQTPEDIALSSEDSSVEARMRAAEGAGKIPFRQRLAEKIETIKQETQHFKFLDTATDGVLIDVLRLFENAPKLAKARTANVLAGITSGLNKKTYRVFSRILALEDIQKDLDNGLLAEDDLPFGYQNRATLENDLAKYKAISELNPQIQRAIERRNRFMDSLRVELVDRGLLPEEALQDSRYFHHQVLEVMAAKRGFGLASGEVRTKTKGWQKARSGKGYDFNLEYAEAEGEVIAQALQQIDTHKTLQKIKAEADISDKLKQDAKDLGVADWRTIIPEGYVLWQPKKGNNFYPATALNEKIVDDVLSLGEAEVTPEDLSKIMAIGAKRLQWAIPERVAKQLDNFREFKDETWVGNFTRNLQTTWKQWTLLNPYRVLKYNLNNMSGDADIALAYNPKIFRYFRQAAGEAYALMKGRAPRGDMVDALRLAVADSGISINEIEDLKEEGFFKLIMGEKGSAVENYWQTVRDYTNFRENILRIAAFKHFKEELANNPNKRLYAASKQKEMDALYDSENVTQEQIAAKLSRELIGDYGNISQAGQYIRQKLIPFYSWMEINMPRYVRLMKNLPKEGRSNARAQAIGAAKLAGRAGITGVKITALFNATYLWNMVAAAMLGMTDEERDRVTKRGGQHHIIIGREEGSGTVQTIRFQGALQDALSFFGLDSPWEDAKKIAEGELEIGDKLIEMVKATPEKLINASVPVYKTAAEALTGRKLYPNPWNPAPVRDKLEHILKMWSLDMPYRLAFKPSRGVGSELSSILTYGTDVGEQAYADTVNRVRKFLEENGKEIPAMIPKKKSNSLYYFKQAMKYGDTDKALKFLKQYIKLGGTADGLKQSIKMLHPLAFGDTELRRKFVSELSGRELEDLKLAVKWYGRTYLGTTPPPQPEEDRREPYGR